MAEKPTLHPSVKETAFSDIEDIIADIRDGKMVSYLTSGNYGHALGGSVAMGYVPCKGETEEQVLASTYEIEIAGRRVSAKASLAPMLDPKASRMRKDQAA